MPELARTKSYRLPALEYTPPRFTYRPPPSLEASTEAASTLKGSTVTMANVADTLAQIPDLIGGNIERGKKLAQKHEVSDIKMGALRNGLTAQDKARYDGLIFGADDSVALKTEDPYIAELKAAALQNRLNPPVKPTPYESQWGFNAPASPAGALSRGGPMVAPSSAVTADLRQRQPALGGLRVQEPPLPENDGEMTLGDPLPPPDEAQVLPPLAKAPAIQNANNLPVLPPDEEAGVITVQPAYKGGPAYKKRNGKIVATWGPGDKGWVKETAEPRDPVETHQDTLLVDRGYDISEIKAMSPQEKSAALKQPKVAANKPIARQYQQALEWGVDIAGMDRDAASAAIQAKIGAHMDLPPALQKSWDSLRGEMGRNKAINTAGIQNKGFGNILAGYEQHNGAGDMMMIDGFARLINPSMGVTGQMVTNFKDALPLMEKWFQLPIDKFTDGAKLTEEGREMFMRAAKAAHEKEMAKVEQAIGAYVKIGKQKGLDPAQVRDAAMQAYLVSENEPAPITTPGQAGVTGSGQPARITSQEEFDALPSGALFIDDSGLPKRKK